MKSRESLLNCIFASRQNKRQLSAQEAFITRRRLNKVIIKT